MENNQTAGDKALSYRQDTSESHGTLGVEDVGALPLSKRRTSSLHSCCCIVFARMQEIQSPRRYWAAGAVFQVICPL